MHAILLAILSFVTFGSGDVYGTEATRKVGPYTTTVWYIIFRVLIFAIIAPLFVNQIKQVTSENILLTMILGILAYGGLIAFYEGLRLTSASIVGTIAGSSSAITVLLSTMLLGETLNLSQISAIALILVGLVTTTLDFNEIKNKTIKVNKGMLLAFISMFSWGIYWAFIKFPIADLGWFWPPFIMIGGVVPLLWLVIKLKKEKIVNPIKTKSFKPIFLNVLLFAIGELAFNYALTIGQASIIAPIVGAYPVLFSILAYLKFRDPVSRQQIVGIITTLAGIVSLSIFSA